MIKCSHINGEMKVMTCLKKKLDYTLAESQDELLITTKPIHIIHQKIKPVRNMFWQPARKVLCHTTPQKGVDTCSVVWAGYSD